jgi:glycosyltransferase involved in cell wall biosynthesis
MPDSSLLISVIVSTYQRVEKLGECVTSLSCQTFPATGFEIIVVNNYPPARATVEQVVRENLAASATVWRIIEAPTPGLYHARCAGLQAARGEIVCFIDDDATAAADWLAQLAQAYAEHPQAGVIGGHICLVPPEPRPYVLQGGRERYWSHFVTKHAAYTEVENYWEFPWGANWSARREPLIQAGGFQTELEGFAEFERQGLAFIGDDLLAASRVARLGYRIAILPQAVVYHHVAPERFTFKHIWRRIYAGVVFRHIARRHLVSRSAETYERAKLPTLFQRQGPAPLIVWEIACYLWASTLVFAHSLSWQPGR